MNILFFDQREFAETDLLWGLLELGYEPESAETRVPDTSYTEEDVQAIIAELGNASLVVTKDFSAATAEACHRAGRIYLSWVHDAPQRSLFMKEARYDTNIIFLFDRAQTVRLSPLGIPHLFHMPLAANCTRVSTIEITDEDIRHYATDASLIGNLYSTPERKAYLERLRPEIRSEVERILSEKVGNWKDPALLFRPLKKELLDALLLDFEKNPPELADLPLEYALQVTLLAHESAMRERFLVLETLADLCGVTLYTSHPEGLSLPQSIKICGHADYYSEVSKIFHASKLNLNITQPSIESGVPQRVFDIMSAGGFVMCNEQEEARELFVPDEELVLFSSPEELREKAAYYLSHERERATIALNGFKRVARDYTVTRALSSMLAKTEEVFGKL